ncbi:MAG: hypothetical protein QOJ79_306 [Actinomycetota bacterium]|jgi:hypothetical protein|nr:hypothetical protein [Actinomycetota bacterium]
MRTSPDVMALLEQRVPLTLLLDLADVDRLPSRVILRREPADLSWLPAPRAGRVGQPAAARPS